MGGGEMAIRDVSLFFFFFRMLFVRRAAVRYYYRRDYNNATVRAPPITLLFFFFFSLFLSLSLSYSSYIARFSTKTIIYVRPFPGAH